MVKEESFTPKILYDSLYNLVTLWAKTLKLRRTFGSNKESLKASFVAPPYISEEEA